MTVLSRVVVALAGMAALVLGLATEARATTFTTTVPGTSIVLPGEYPEAGGIAMVMIGVNGNIYYQFSDPDGAFKGFQFRGQPSAFRGNPFTINDPITLDCGWSSCTDYFGGAIAEMHIRFTADDGDTQPGGFDENDIFLRMNGYTVGSWSGMVTESTDLTGTVSYGFGTGFGNNTFDTGWFYTDNAALLDNILTTGQTTTQVFDRDPDDNRWDFSRGESLADAGLRTVAPGYTIEKTANLTEYAGPGAEVTYTYIVTNIGSVEIYDLAVDDDRILAPNTVTCDKTTIVDRQTGETPDSATCTATYMVTQADFDAGSITNVATATGRPAYGDLGAVSDTVTITAGPPLAALSVEKTAAQASFPAAGGQVDYTVTVTNSGNVSLTGVSASDPMLSGFSCGPADLAPLEALTCTGSYTVTQADVDAYAASGTQLVNTASASATDPGGAPVTATGSLALDGPAPAPAMNLAKVAQEASYAAPGDVLTWLITVNNTGNVTFPDAPAISDSLTTVDCPTGPVPPGGSVTCSASYTVTQADIDAGSVTNTATASITVNGAGASASGVSEVDAARSPALSLDKVLAGGSPASFDAEGTALTYEYVVTNTGNVTIETIALSDDKVALSCPQTSLAPSLSMTCTSDPYLTGQGDLDAGGVTNTVTLTATEAGTGTPLTLSDSLTVPATQSPALSLAKTAPAVDPADYTAGTTVTYSYTVTNSGNVTLTEAFTGAAAVQITDDRIGSFTCGPLPLAPGADLTCTADYVITAADVATGFVTNTASASAGSVSSPITSATIAPDFNPAISLAKSASPAIVASTGDSVTYTFTVTNSGDTVIEAASNPVSIADARLDGPADCSAQPASLAPGASFTCTGSIAGATQAEMDAGEIVNTATASFPFTSGGVTTTVSSPEASAVVAVDQQPGLDFTKAGPPRFGAVGSTVTYSLTASNSGNVTLSGVTVSDPLLPGLSCGPVDLAPGADLICSGDYIVTQADVDAELIVNTAEAAATAADGSPLTQGDTESTAILPAEARKEAAIAKSASPAAFTGPGELITYTLAVSNTGTQTLSALTVTDALDAGYSCTIASLAPGATDQTCVFTYVTTQADVDAGSVANSASVAGAGITTASDGLTLDGPARLAALALDKTGPAAFAAPGEVVDFTLTVSNAGNVTLTDVTLSDTFFDPDLTCVIPSLAPGASDASCTGSYTITQADVDAGSITNTASASATAPSGVTAPAAAGDSVTVDGPAEAPALSLVKTPADGSFGALPDSESYSFEVFNTGNVTLTGLSFEDADLGFACALDDLGPGDSTTVCSGGAPLSASHTVTQADIDAGSYTNSATVTGQTLQGTPAGASDTVTITGPPQAPAVTMTKTATSAGPYDTVGDTITYDYVVTNAGNITLTSPVSVSDDRIAEVTCPPLPAGGLAPGASLTCTGTDTVTQADLDAGSVTNTATAQVLQPVVGSATPAEVTSAPIPETVTVDQLPALSLAKAPSAAAPASYDAAGDTVTYDYTVTNTGNVTTTADVTITDDRIPGGPHLCAPAGIAPGASVTCQLVWTASQADVDTGSVTNTATASTDYGAGTVTSDPASATIAGGQSPSLAVDKTFTGTSNPGGFNEGDNLSYQIVVTNNGNVTIDAPITLDDNLAAPSCPPVPGGALAPGDTLICTAAHTVTANDIDLGGSVNVVTATGSFAGTPVTSPADEAVYPLDASPAISMVKSAPVGSSFAAVGEVITYSYTLTNTGNVALTGDITVEDDTLGAPFLCRPASEGSFNAGSGGTPGDSYTCTADYTVTQDDLDRGFVTNNATAHTIYAPSGDATDVTSPNAAETVPADTAPSLSLAKVVSAGPASAAAGDVLTYTLTAANDGNQTLAGVTISDPMLGALSCTVGGSTAPANTVLAPGEELICTGSYTVTQADIDAQSLSNSASARGTSPQGADVPTDAVLTHPLQAANPSLSLAKALVDAPASGPAFEAVGQELVFELSATNTGNVTLSSVVISEGLPTAPASCEAGPLAPGEIGSCQVVYTVTQADIDALYSDAGGEFGGIENTISATATAASPGAETAAASADLFLRGPDRAPAFTLNKTSETTAITEAGQVVTYTFTVANTGNVTLYDQPVITDDRIGTFACGTIPAGGLAPLDFVSCTATDTVTQADMDSGALTNTATVASDEVPLPADPGNALASLTIPANRSPALTLEKSASPTSGVTAGSTVTYSYVVTNTGNVTLSGVGISDQQTSAAGTAPLILGGDTLLTAGAEPSLDDPAPGYWASLAPGASIGFTASYTVTQADIDAQVTLSNTATVSAEGPSGAVTGGSDTVEVPVAAAAPALRSQKAAQTSGLSEPPVAGEVVSFLIGIANDGNQTLSAVTLSDTLRRADGTLLALDALPAYSSGDTGSDGLLAPGETWFYDAAYTLTQADIDAGGVSNIAVAGADTPAGATLSASSGGGTPLVVPLTRAPGIEATKTVASGGSAPGDLITFEILLANTGNVTLSATGIASDTLTRLDGSPIALDGTPVFTGADLGSGAGTLLPGETARYLASYTLTQADIDAGGIANSALATGTGPDGTEVTDVSGNGAGDDAPATLAIAAAPSLALSKGLDPAGPVSVSAVGDTILYAFALENTGNVTLSGPFSVSDPLIEGAGGAVTCPAGPLAPGASLTCTGSYAVTQADLDAGGVTNSATASAGGVSAPASSVTVPAIQAPSLALDKTAEPVPAAEFVTGRVVTYTYLLTNDGNITLDGPFAVDDNLIPASAISCDPVPAGGLAPGATLECTGTYTVTADDVDLGSVTNLASVSDAVATSPLVSETIPEQGNAALEIAKSADAGASFAAVGDMLSYSYTVTNTGTRAFAAPVEVVDDRIGTIACFTPDAGDPDLTAGESVTCTASYTVTQDDLDAGEVTNQAYALTTYGGGGSEVVSPPAAVTVPGNLTPGLTLEKTASPDPASAAGEEITYSLRAVNSGNQTLSNVAVTDPLLDGFTCTAESLAPEAELLCTGSYTVTQADVDAGSVLNTAAASAVTPQGAPSATSAAHSLAMPAPAPSMLLEKTTANDPFGPVGSSVTYVLSVTNTGNVTLGPITVSDALAPGQDCTIASLAPGATNANCAVSITVTQADVDAGEITNTASASGLDPFGTPADAAASLTTAGPPRVPGLDAAKIALPAAGAVGTVVTYELQVTNTGNVTITPDAPSDSMTRLDGSPTKLDAPFALDRGDDGNGLLDVGETWVYAAPYTLTQADLNAGGMSNSASISGTGAGGIPVSDLADDGDDSDGDTEGDPTVFEILQEPALTVTKAVAQAGSAPGDTVVFEITALNNGNVDLDGLAVVDTLSRADGSPAGTVEVQPVSVPVPLSPGATASWTASHVLTQADIDAGGLSNSAVVQALAPSGAAVSDVSADTDTADGELAADPAEMPIAPAPGLEVLKTVLSAGSAAGEEVVFEIAVTNVGNVTLGSITLDESLSRLDGTPLAAPAVTFAGNSASSPEGSLAVNETGTWRATHVLSQDDVDAGGVVNSVTANALTPFGAPSTALSSDGSGAGVPTTALIGAAPELAVTKTAALSEPLYPSIERSTFTITVENTGNITQTGLSVIDDLAGFAAPATLLPEDYPAQLSVTGFGGGAANPAYDGIAVTETLAPGATLAPGESGTVTITVTYSAATGRPGSNTATAGSDQLDGTRSATAPANSLDSDGDGIPDHIEGNGDRDGDGIPNDRDYDPTGHFYCEDDGRILAGGGISVSGNGFTQEGAGSNGPIHILRDGSDGQFQFYVTAPGTYTLGLSYPPGGLPSEARLSQGTLDLSPAGGNPQVVGAGQTGETGRLADYAEGTNPFYTAFTVEEGDPAVINNNIPLTACLGTPDVLASKTASRDSAVLGDSVGFTLEFRNDSPVTLAGARAVDLLPEGLVYTPGTGTVGGAEAEPVVEGRRLTWEGLTLRAGETLRVTLSARVRSGTLGRVVNRTWLEDSAGTRRSNTATAALEIRPEHVFNCADVTGKVFDDRNGNGYQDGPGTLFEPVTDADALPGGKLTRSAPPARGEPGIPGVRIATLAGTVLTTDAQGRFHVPCAELPGKTGANFTLKLDPRSLPEGYAVTTENPRVMRLTAGKVAKMNFGAMRANPVEIGLTAAAFASGSAQPGGALARAIAALPGQLGDQPVLLRLSYLAGSAEDSALARARLAAAEEALRRAFKGREMALTATLHRSEGASR